MAATGKTVDSTRFARCEYDIEKAHRNVPAAIYHRPNPLVIQAKRIAARFRITHSEWRTHPTSPMNNKPPEGYSGGFKQLNTLNG